MVVILGIALVSAVCFLLSVVSIAAMEMVDDHIPAHGPFRHLAVARTARREAADIDAEYRQLLAS